jgi:signal transduction histidine kinase
LGAIKGAAQCLNPESLPSEANEFVHVIIDEVDRLNHVVGQFLEYARPYRGEVSRVQPNDVVRATLRLLATEPRGTGAHIEPDYAPDVPEVFIDPEQLKQVLINLVRNASQAVGEAGAVHVRTRGSHPRSIEGGAEAVIEVHDTGPGIREDDLPRIFMPFFTTKPGGTGLGLAISKRIVDNAGGKLEVDSTPGQGATFSIHLPAAQGAEHPTTVALSSSQPSTDPAI